MSESEKRAWKLWNDLAKAATSTKEDDVKIIAAAFDEARSQAFEEASKIAEARIELFTSYGSGLTGRNALKEAANSIRSQAIRQHSQKGKDK